MCTLQERLSQIVSRKRKQWIMYCGFLLRLFGGAMEGAGGHTGARGDTTWQRWNCWCAYIKWHVVLFDQKLLAIVIKHSNWQRARISAFCNTRPTLGLPLSVSCNSHRALVMLAMSHISLNKQWRNSLVIHPSSIRKTKYRGHKWWLKQKILTMIHIVNTQECLPSALQEPTENYFLLKPQERKKSDEKEFRLTLCVF